MPRQVRAPPADDPHERAELEDAPPWVQQKAEGDQSDQAELTEATLDLVQRHPGRLSVAMATHVLWGSRGPVTRERYGADPGYGILARRQHKEIREGITSLVSDGTLKQNGSGHLSMVGGRQVSD